MEEILFLLMKLKQIISVETISKTLQKNFNFDGKIYKQTDGVAMGSLLGPRLANAFLCFHEQMWLNNFPKDFKPAYYSTYVDGMFALFCSPNCLEK